MDALREITLLSVVLRTVIAIILGGLIGLERGLKHRPAGLRTYMVVCLGACLIMLTNQYIYQTTHAGDPVRMGAQVVSGIGFLGAGTIIVTRRNQIKGLTTAAGLWAAAGIGLAVGIGFYEAAVVGGLSVFLVMAVIQFIDRNVQRKCKNLELYLEMTNTGSLGDFLRVLRSREIDILDVQHEYTAINGSDTRSYILNIKLKKRQNHLELLEDLRNISNVVFLEKL